MIIVKDLLFEEKEETFREFLDRRLQLGRAGHDDGSAEVAWSNPSFDETYGRMYKLFLITLYFLTISVWKS